MRRLLKELEAKVDFEDGIWRHEPDMGLTFVWPLAEQAKFIGAFNNDDEMLFSWSVSEENPTGETMEEQIESMIQAVKERGLSSVVNMLAERGES